VGEGGKKVTRESQNLHKAVPCIAEQLTCMGLCFEKVKEQQSQSLALLVIRPTQSTLQIRQCCFRPLLFFPMS